jgi:tight adherence protein C
VTPAVLLAALAGVLGAVGIVDAAVVVGERRAAAALRGDEGRAARWARALARLGGRVGAPAPARDLPARLAAAGLPPAVRPADVMAAKAGAGVVVAALAAPVAGSLPMRLAVVALAASAIGGFVAPDAWLRRRARARAARAALELADVLDLLCVAVQAGLPIGRALAEVGRRRGGLVAAELRAVAARTELGVGRSEALAILRARLPVPAVAALIAALDRADRHGAPLAPALIALAEEARTERAQELHRRAAAAAPRIQLAIALLLVPAALLIVAAGLVPGLG